MKKALVLALCVVGFILIAAPTAMEYAPLFINGKPAGQAVLVNGVIAISVEQAAKAGGATLTLQPFFARQANRFLAVLGDDALKHKDSTTVKLVPAVQAGSLKQSDAGAIKINSLRLPARSSACSGPAKSPQRYSSSRVRLSSRCPTLRARLGTIRTPVASSRQMSPFVWTSARIRTPSSSVCKLRHHEKESPYSVVFCGVSSERRHHPRGTAAPADAEWKVVRKRTDDQRHACNVRRRLGQSRRDSSSAGKQVGHGRHACTIVAG